MHIVSSSQMTRETIPHHIRYGKQRVISIVKPECAISTKEICSHRFYTSDSIGHSVRCNERGGNNNIHKAE